MKIFISYSHIDKDDAVRVIGLLKDRGEETAYYIDEKMEIGERITDEVLKEIKECTHVLVILSPASLKSQWVTFEIGSAKALGKGIIPYLTHPSLEVPEFLRGIKRANSFGELRAWLEEIIGKRISAQPSRDSGTCSRNAFILTVGGANGEYTLQLSSKLEPNSKHLVKARTLIGGSGLNFTLRLLSAGVPAVPVLALGDDELGRKIHQEVAFAARDCLSKDSLAAFIGTDTFFVPGLHTPRSTIVAAAQQRTIFKEETEGEERFLEYLPKALDRICEHQEHKVCAVMIGHIQADRIVRGQCTRLVIERFKGSCPIFTNFGDSQIRLGFEHWKDLIKDIAIFQLNLSEMKLLFAKNGNQPSLRELIELLTEESMTAVITLDRFGAICTFRESKESIIIAWPFELDEIVDTTGAGDAFGAGLVSQICGQACPLSFGHFFNAISEARFWAAYACGSLGGASDCPTIEQLREYKAKIQRKGAHPVEVKDKETTREILRILDKAF